MSNDYFKYINNFEKYKHIESKLVIGSLERKKRLFTIAIPTYKRETLIVDAINSAINQYEVQDYEIVVVDNDPEDNETEKIIRKINNDKVYYFKNEKNIGMFGNWNRCIELAQGKYITILNDDDWLGEMYLKKCSEYLTQNTDGLYFPNFTINNQNINQNINRCKYIYVKKILKVLSRDKKRLTVFDFFLGNQSAGSLGILMQTEYLKMLGGYNDNYYPSSDYVLHANYCYNYSVYRINIKMNYYRIGENESAKQETLKKWEYIDNEIKKYLISVMGKRKRFHYFLNKLIQENYIDGLVKAWNYKTNSKRKYNLLRNIFSKIVSLKYFLNI